MAICIKCTDYLLCPGKFDFDYSQSVSWEIMGLGAVTVDYFYCVYIYLIFCQLLCICLGGYYRLFAACKTFFLAVNVGFVSFMLRHVVVAVAVAVLFSSLFFIQETLDSKRRKSL